MTSSTLRCVLLGGGGHARMVIEAMRLSHIAEPTVILDRAEKLWATTVDDVPVLGNDSRILEIQDAECFTVSLGHGPRIHLYSLGLKAKLQPLNIIHPRAIISSRAVLGSGIHVFAGAIVNPGAIVANNVILNTGSIVEHDCVIQNHVHISVGARITGSVTVEEGAFLGAGCTVLPGLRIGTNATVGAGAVVTKDVPSNTVVAGVPARFLKK